MRLINADLMFECETCRHHRSGGCNTYCDHGEEYSPDMSKLPIIDPEDLRPKGEWIAEREKDTFGYLLHFKCSLCEKYQLNKTHYCPNCGANNGGK